MIREAQPFIYNKPGALVFGYDARLVDFLAGYQRVGNHMESRCHVIAVIDHRPEQLAAAVARQQRYERRIQMHVVDVSQMRNADDVEHWIGRWRVGLVFVNYDYPIDFSSLLDKGAVIRKPEHWWKPARVQAIRNQLEPSL